MTLLICFIICDNIIRYEEKKKWNNLYIFQVYLLHNKCADCIKSFVKKNICIQSFEIFMNRYLFPPLLIHYITYNNYNIII